MTDDPDVIKYLKETLQIPMLKPQEEVELSQRIKQGDELALQKLVKGNLRFVIYIAKSYHMRAIPLSDLINEGNLGLIKAAKQFDETRGFKLISYAIYRIKGSILKALADDLYTVRLPYTMASLPKKATEACQILEQDFLREVSCQEISEFLGVSEVRVANALNSKEIFLDIEDDRFDEPILPCDDCLEQESVSQGLSMALKTLSVREAKILTLYYGLGGMRALNLEEVGECFGVTRERIRQVKNRALFKLRYNLPKKYLEEHCLN